MIKTVIAIYPGRFQPFGKHHAESFKWLQSKFGKANTYIATSNVIDLPKSPFSFKDKSDIIKHYGIADRVVQVKNPYKSEEILSKFDPNTTAVVFMVGSKDMQDDPRFAMKPKKDGSASYFQAYEKNKENLQGFDKHGYLIVAPHVSINVPGYGEMSGTTLRKVLGAETPRSQKISVFKSVFGWYDQKTADMIFDKLEALQESKLTISEVMKKKNMSKNTTESVKLFSKNWWSETLNLSEKYADEYPKGKYIQLSKQKAMQYADEIIDMIISAYASKGGNFEFKSANDLKNSELNFWILNDLDNDPDPDVTLAGKPTPYGTKMTVAGQDGSSDARKAVLTKMKDLLRTKGFYAEFDIDLANKMNLMPIEDESIVRSVLSPKEITWNGDGTYQRDIAGYEKTKVLVGIPKNVSNKSVREGYMTPEQAEKHSKKIKNLKAFLHANIGREFVYDFDKFPKTVYGVKMPTQGNINESLLKEGGAGGHMAHPFDIDWVKTGKDLVKAFEMSINYLKNGPASVKIDGVNASIRLITLDGRKTFVLDRGSNKPLDVKGITKADLTDRFGDGHGMIQIGGTVLDIFNKALPDITTALKKLKLWDNPNIMFNLEYVAGSTNVLSYNKNFLAVHGLLEIFQATPTRRATKEVSYSDQAMQELLDNLQPIAETYGYEVLGSIPTKLQGTPNLATELNKSYTVNYGQGKSETKTLSQWLANCIIPRDNIKTVQGKTIAALSKDVLIKISEGTPLNEYIANPKDYKAAIDGFVTYMATMKLGDAILDKLSSPLGPVSAQEGIVIRDPKIYKEPYKITGKFILGGLASSFKK